MDTITAHSDAPTWDDLIERHQLVLRALADAETQSDEGITVRELCTYGIESIKDAQSALQRLYGMELASMRGSGAEARYSLTRLGRAVVATSEA